MGNCTASKLTGGGEEEEVVALCRERKKLLKAAVDGRYSLAVAHSKYTHSLCAVAAAINLFVTRHSTPTPILITLPPPSPPTEPKTEERTSLSSSCSSSSSSSRCSCEVRGVEVSGNGELGCGYFYNENVEEPVVESFGWDFFNPFDGVMVGLERRSSDEELRAVREEEGIPELEEEEEEGGGGEGKEVAVEGEVGGDEVVKVDGCSSEDGLAVVEEAPTKERDLLEALRDVEDHLVRAYVSGKDVMRMLEATCIAPVFDDVKENSSKLAITWHRSSSSRSSSHRSFLASSSRSTSYAESKCDLFDECVGMASGSHSQTLGRLYAWEKKLYEEVKAGDDTRRMYERKCSQLRNRDAKGSDSRSMDKVRAAAKDLHTRIWVAIRSAETISEKIQKLRDEELHPQLVELLQGLKKTWKVMLESHDTQNQIMSEVNTFTCPSYGKFCSDAHRFATLQLDAELQNWRACFMSYITSQKEYVEALDGWLSKFLVPEVELFSHGRSSLPPYRPGAPPLFLLCHDWLAALKRLPDKPVSNSLRMFSRDVRVLWIKQGEEQLQKRRVDSLAKELDKKVLSLQKAENRIIESKLSDNINELEMRRQVEHLTGRKEMLEMFKKRLDVEKTKHHSCMQETQRITLNGFKTGFMNVFESLTEFSKDALKMYDDLVNYNEKVETGGVSNDKAPCIEGGQVDGCRQLPEVMEPPSS